jgi:hypothetical protein
MLILLPSTAQESHSFAMKRFLENRDDEIWLHQGLPNQDASRIGRVQTVIDRVNQLGPPGKDGESKADK